MGMGISNKYPLAVIPSDLRGEKQRVSYPAKVPGVSQALLLTTKVRGDDGGDEKRAVKFINTSLTNSLVSVRLP